MPDRAEILADDGNLAVTAAADPGGLGLAADLLDRAERETGTPLVDEAERQRLGHALEGEAPTGWHPALARHDGQVVGYLAVTTDASTAAGDVAVLSDHAAAMGLDVDADLATGPDRLRILGVLLAAATRLAEHHGADRLQVWTRRAGDPEVATARRVGFEVVRRLGVLGRVLDAAAGEPPATAATVRAYRPGTDDEAVVEVLAAAYRDTAEQGWDLDRFRARTRLPWFRPDDLLVAELDGAPDGVPALAGLHWLKRRDARTGEVYNLAIHPRAQGHRLGPLLLHAGLEHLRAQGCDDVILWVDLANERAVDLYRAQGFTTRWLDLALGRTL